MFSATDFEKKSLLAVCIRELVLLRQCLYWFQFFNLWLESRCLMAAFMSSLNHSGCVSFLTLLFFKGAFLLRTFKRVLFMFSKFKLESKSDITKVSNAVDSCLRKIAH